MEFEKLSKLSMERKKEILADLIKNDTSYFKKIMILMAMVEENEDTELLDLIVEHRREEIELANKKYDLSIENKKVEVK